VISQVEGGNAHVNMFMKQKPAVTVWIFQRRVSHWPEKIFFSVQTNVYGVKKRIDFCIFISWFFFRKCSWQLL